jgi:hypothetical protein
MNAFIYQADLYCEPAGLDICSKTPFPNYAERDDESTDPQGRRLPRLLNEPVATPKDGHATLRL